MRDSHASLETRAAGARELEMESRRSIVELRADLMEDLLRPVAAAAPSTRETGRNQLPAVLFRKTVSACRVWGSSLSVERSALEN